MSNGGQRRAALAATTLLGAALACRIATVLARSATPAGRYPLIDSAFYLAQARALAAGLGWGPGAYFMNPLYPYLLAPLVGAGGGVRAIGLVQACLGALSVALIGWLAGRWFGRRAGWLALGLAAFYGPFWFYDAAVLTASPMVLASAALLVCLERLRGVGIPAAAVARGAAAGAPGAAGRGSLRWAAAAGIVGGLGALLRPNVLLVMALLPLVPGLGGGGAPPAARPGRPSGERRRRLGPLRALLVVWGTCALVILPVAVRNRLVSGETVLLTSAAGMNFYTGNQPGATGIYDGAPFVSSYEPAFEEADFRREAERRSGRRLSARGASRFWLAEGWRAISRQPLAWLGLELRKLWLLLHPVEPQNNLSLYVVRDWVPLLRWNPLDYRLVAPLAALGLVLHWRRRRALALPLLFAAAQVATMLLFFVSSEYRLPLLVVLLPAAAAGLAGIGARLRGRRVAGLRGGLLALAVVLLAGSRQTDLTRRLTWKRIDYLNFATLAEGAGDDAEALALLDRALALDPDFRPALARQAALARRLGLEPLAARARARLTALPAGPAPILLWDVDRAVGLYRAGRYADALDVFERLAAERPGEPRLLNDIGLCLYKLGRQAEAEPVLRRAIAADSTYVRAQHNLALVLAARGRRRQAIAGLRALLAVEPRHWRSRLKLIDWYLAGGEPVRARLEADSLVLLGAEPPIVERAQRRLQAAAGHREP